MPFEPPDLPVLEALPAVVDGLRDHTSAILVAPPGAGKTTLAPLMLLDEAWLGTQRIVMLEPRRLATRAAAQRMASLLGERVGDTVGYQTRDERHIGPHTRIEVVTEGVLTRRLQHDATLDGYGLVIFDEVHERNLPTDLGLALALDARDTLRPDLPRAGHVGDTRHQGPAGGARSRHTGGAQRRQAASRGDGVGADGQAATACRRRWRALDPAGRARADR